MLSGISFVVSSKGSWPKATQAKDSSLQGGVLGVREYPCMRHAGVLVLKPNADVSLRLVPGKGLAVPRCCEEQICAKSLQMLLRDV